MKIVQYISELIQANGNITIPEFGAFILMDTSTKIDDSKNLISPPSKILTFNENVKENDNVLVDYLIKEERISKEAAEEALFKFVFQLKNLLASGKTVDFRNIGKFHTNNKKQIVFEMDNKVEYISDSFGLITIKAKTYSQDKIKQKKSTKEAKIKPEKPSKKMPKAAIWIIIIFIPIIALATLAFLYPNDTKKIFTNTKNSIIALFHKSNSDNNNIIAKIDDTLKTSIKPLDKDTTTIHLNTNNSSINGIKENNTIKNEVKPVVDENKKFHIIVGCFQSKQNAENYFKTIQSKGYTPRMFEPGNDGLYKVSCSSFSSRDEAKKELSKVTKDIGAQAWILKK